MRNTHPLLALQLGESDDSQTMVQPPVDIEPPFLNMAPRSPTKLSDFYAHEMNPHRGLHKSHPTIFLLFQDLEITSSFPLICRPFMHHAWGQTLHLSQHQHRSVFSWPTLSSSYSKTLKSFTVNYAQICHIRETGSFLKSDVLSHVPFELGQRAWRLYC